jgi:protease-4
MISSIIVFLINLSRLIHNGWRQLLRRRVDYVRIEIGGALPEFAPAPPWWQRRFLGARAPASLQALRRAFQRIAADPQTTGVVLKIDDLEAGWATLQSLRDEIGWLRAQGKRVVAYLMRPGMRAYYAACAADQILIPPAAFVPIVGLRTEVRFLKDALEKVGIAAEYVAVSPYKSAGEPYVRSDISPESRAQLDRLLDVRFDQIVRAIADARGKTAGEVRALIDAAPLSPRAALDAGMVDRLCYEDELETYLGTTATEITEQKIEDRGSKIEDSGPPSADRYPLSSILHPRSSVPSVAHKPGRRAIILDWGAAKKALRLQPARRQRKIVAVVPIEGTIATGRSRAVPLPIPLLGGKQAGADSVAQALRQVERNRRAAAVVLYVNSPGGDGFASDLIWREVARVGRSKPLVVAMGDAAASGGYYVAAPAAAIVAQPGTLTGSIGVFVLRPILAGLLERAGVNTVVLSRGANSGFLGGTQPPSESERQALRDLVFTFYDDFKQRVLAGRKIGMEQLDQIAGGRVWMGQEAAELGLVDHIGGLPEAILRAQELAGLPPDRTAPIMLARGGRSPLPPQPFPVNEPADLERLLHDLLLPRVWAALPFEGI